jgi:hypothetical protein
MYPHNKFIKGKENIPLLFVLKHNLLCLSQHCTSIPRLKYYERENRHKIGMSITYKTFPWTVSLHSVLHIYNRYQNNNRTQQMSATWSITYFFKK